MEGSEFGHRGQLCTFEMMKFALGLDDAGLRTIGEIVHEIDLHDGRYAQPEIAGVESILAGWSSSGLSDEALEARGISLFEGLYSAVSQSSVAKNEPGSHSRK